MDKLSWKQLFCKYKKKDIKLRNRSMIVLYNYVARTDRDLGCVRGEILSLIAKDPASHGSWWLVERTSTHERGWVPSGYLEYAKRHVRSNLTAEVEERDKADSSNNTNEKGKDRPFMVRAKFDYLAANDSELSFKKYDLMAVTPTLERYPPPGKIPHTPHTQHTHTERERERERASERAVLGRCHISLVCVCVCGIVTHVVGSRGRFGAHFNGSTVVR